MSARKIPVAPMDSQETIEPAEGYIQTDEGQLHYLDWGGSGPQAHFLHANGFCAGTYSPFIKYLIHDLHVFASDARGHGSSDHPTSRRIRNWNIFVEDLKTLVERILAPPVIGMGHSLGAVTTYMAAARYPHLFSGIVLFDPSILPRRILWKMVVMKLFGFEREIPLAKTARRRKKTFQGKIEALKRFTSGRGIFKTWSKEFVEAYLECGLLEKDAQTAVLKCDPELEAQIFESVPVDVWKYGKKITCPVLVIRGEQSDVLTVDSTRRLKSIIVDCEIRTIPATGHFVSMEKPQECAQLIADFIPRVLGNMSAERA
jgi:pimeloyl-ACP methyl ester carboxylesterase